MLKLAVQQGIFLLLAFLLGGCGLFGNEEDPKKEIIACTDISSEKWNLLGLEEESVTAIAVHPKHSGIIYAGTASNFSDDREGKLFKTIDCGKNWEVLVVGGSFRVVELSPDDPSVIYAVNGGILKSVDSGKNWQPSREGIEQGGAPVASLAIDPENPQVLYAGTSGNFGGSFYKSTNGGEIWNEVEGTGLEENWLESGVTSIAIDPANSQHIFVGTAWRGDVLRSTDGGDTWEPTALFDSGSIVHEVIIDIQTTITLYAGLNRKGLYKTDDVGESWSLISNDYLSDTTSIVELELNIKGNELFVVTTYGDSGKILKKNLTTSKWTVTSAPIEDTSFYYSQLKVYEANKEVFLFMGLSGVYIKKLGYGL